VQPSQSKLYYCACAPATTASWKYRISACDGHVVREPSTPSPETMPCRVPFGNSRAGNPVRGLGGWLMCLPACLPACPPASQPSRLPACLSVCPGAYPSVPAGFLCLPLKLLSHFKGPAAATVLSLPQLRKLTPLPTRFRVQMYLGTLDTSSNDCLINVRLPGAMHWLIVGMRSKAITKAFHMP